MAHNGLRRPSGRMSALGSKKQTSADVKAKSASPTRADIPNPTLCESAGRSEPLISFADEVDDSITLSWLARELLPDLLEQSCSARILIESHSLDLAQVSLPTRHHHFEAVDFDRDLLACNLAKEIGA